MTNARIKRILDKTIFSSSIFFLLVFPIPGLKLLVGSKLYKIDSDGFAKYSWPTLCSAGYSAPFES